MNNIVTYNRAFRIIVLGWLILASLLALTSCTNNSQPKDSKSTAEEHNDAKFPNNPEEKDAQYLVDAYSSGLFEIESSQHAKQKAIRADVKELASEVIQDHAKLNESLKSLSTAKQISLQQGLTENQMEDLKSCQAKKGADYDKMYIQKLVENHEKSVKLAEEASEKAQDTEIRNLFSSALPALRHHLEMAMSLNDKMK